MISLNLLENPIFLKLASFTQAAEGNIDLHPSSTFLPQMWCFNESALETEFKSEHNGGKGWSLRKTLNSPIDDIYECQADTIKALLETPLFSFN